MKALERLPEIIGLHLDEARTISDETGFSIRVMKMDGEHLIGTCDYRTDRINVAIERNTVAAILNVG
jgi:hypothetical protein